MKNDAEHDVTYHPWQLQYPQQNTINSITPMAMQRNWKTASDFPRCPQKIVRDPLYDYGTNLECGCVFSQNQYGEALVDTYELSENRQILSIICYLKNGVKEWGVTEVIVEDKKFIHIAHGTYFDFEGARKVHYKTLGKRWDSGTTFDDLC